MTPTVGRGKLRFLLLPLGVVDLDRADQLSDHVARGRVAVFLHHVADVVLPGLLQERRVLLRALQQLLRRHEKGYVRHLCCLGVAVSARQQQQWRR